ncbi:FadR/GntR family transcriptional regulator [Streptomyces sp. NBC_00878]|uniref:FadR/GntR family transcriptional regulator n=1 Tax=Streptomyces sp. NBC_00878 TaxID=2975854 RepID=UPI002254E1B7|nr:FCD domain-containing protein [Streptomyces sp. NBC_00878]MCX4910766.1 FCD domain-containing protein [Streptomyces sp. NBC_00878]
MNIKSGSIQIGELEPRPRHEVLADAIQRAIALGQFAPGERLPTEREVAEALGLGRTTVSHAFRLLNEQGLVLTKRGRAGGTFVSEVPRKVNRQRILREYGSEVEANFEFRLTVEPVVARLAAERANSVQRDAISDLTHNEPATLASYRANDSQFHLAIADACGNPLFAQAVRDAREQFFNWADALWMIRGQLSADTAMFGHQHHDIGEAIASGDGAKAEEHMRSHLEQSMSSYQAVLRSK